jgi:glycosyltransferase involved in cell wall biosynthesis
MLTVLLATHDGEATLPRTLEALARQDPPEGGWSLVAVDNGSTDATPAILERFARRMPMRVVREPRPGKNRALNRGLEETAGDLVVFTDDDTLPRPDWLRRYRVVADRRTEYDIFGGPVLPDWEVPPPEWILQWVRLDPTYGLLPPGPEGPWNPRLVFGLNMAIRRRTLLGARFDETMGPTGSRYGQGDETELLVRLARAGARTWHCPWAVVRHRIARHQLTRRWVLRKARHFGSGELGLRLRGTDPPGFRELVRATSLEPATAALQALRARLGPSDEAAFRARWELGFRLGEAHAARAALLRRGGG